MYYCRLTGEVSYTGCSDMTVRSEAYDMRWVFRFKGSGMSCVKRLKSVDKRTEPCWAPFVKCPAVEGYSAYACLPERKLASLFFQAGVHICVEAFLNKEKTRDRVEGLVDLNGGFQCYLCRFLLIKAKGNDLG